jgi:hypothetical protein
MVAIQSKYMLWTGICSGASVVGLIFEPILLHNIHTVPEFKYEIPIGIGEFVGSEEIPHISIRVISEKYSGTSQGSQMTVDKCLKMVTVEFMEKGTVSW